MAGIEGLALRQREEPRGRARFAAFFALLPGMGAVYNRQNIKAVVHFVTIVGLFQLASTKLAPAFFALAGLASYSYSIVDAYRTAQSVARGESPAADEERFKRALIKRAPVLGVVLIAAGLLIVLNFLRPFTIITFARLFPVALIILGGYLLTRYFKRSRDEGSEQSPTGVPYALAPGRFGEESHRSARTSQRFRR